MSPSEHSSVCGTTEPPRTARRGLVRLNDGAHQLAPFKFLTSACAHLLDDDQVCHLTWSSKHKAVRRVEQAAYVILMPTQTPHYARSDRASHRYFHSFIQPVWRGAFMEWQFFTRRIFASAQRFRISARAQRFRISANIGLNAYVFCVCSPPSYVAFVQRKRVLTLGY